MSRKGWAKLVGRITLAFSVVIVGVFLLIFYTAQQQNARNEEINEQIHAWVKKERDEKRRAEMHMEFADPIRPAKEDADEFARVFATLSDAANRGDKESAVRVFDLDRLLREEEYVTAFAGLTERDAAFFNEGLRQGFLQKVANVVLVQENLRLSQTTVRHVRWSADRREVMVATLHRTDDPAQPRRMRWWLVRNPDGWKIYDYESTQGALRITRLLWALSTPNLTERFARDPQALQLATNAIRETNALIAQSDFEGADAALAPARLIPYPAQMQAIVEVLEGSILLGRGNAKAALTRFDTADRLMPNLPITLFSRAKAFIHLDRPEDALAAIRLYQKEVGPDAPSCTLEGTVLESQGKDKEAVEAYRQALDEVPESVEAAQGLRRVQANKQ
jgi:tetratricopeptide (TPR) repeat protein